MIKVNPHVARMVPYGILNMQPPAGKRLISLAQNESMLPPSPQALKLAAESLNGLAPYSDPDWLDLKTAIAEIHALDPAMIICGAGSMELIAGLAKCYLDRERSAVTSEYGYAFFKVASQLVQAPFLAAAEVDYQVSVDNLLEAVRDDTSVVFVANPGNPTGTLLPKSELQRLRSGLPRDVLLVIDEAYGEFADLSHNDTAGRWTFDMVASGNTVVLRTFSKAYGLAGARVGWGCFPPEVAAEMRKVNNPGSIATSSLAAAARVMRDQSYMREHCTMTSGIAARFTDNVRTLGLKVPQSFTNFVLIEFASPEEVARIDTALRAEGIFMRGMGGYGLSNCLRATIANEQDMNSAFSILREQTGQTQTTISPT
jgi:histidinol-phosphate aminotransferase